MSGLILSTTEGGRQVRRDELESKIKRRMKP